jgi:hypothetical protein
MNVPISSVGYWIGNWGLKVAWVALYALVVGITMMSHAMWRDEIQAWLIARDSADLSALFNHLHYEGHAALWYLLLMPLTRVSRDPSLMQMLHFAIAISVVVFVLWRAPLSPVEKALFPFGYFTLYEYAVKSRGYALGCLLLFVFCALWRRRRSDPVVVSVVLALLANVDILWMIVSIAAVIALAVDRFTNKAADDLRSGWRFDVLAIAILGFGWAVAVATSMPPADTGIAVGWFFDLTTDRLKMALGTLSVLLSPKRSVLIDIAVLAVLLMAGSRSRNNPAAAIFFAVSALGLMAFFYTKYPDHEWHRGIIWIAFFATVWIDRSSAHSLDTSAQRKPLVPAMVFGAALVCQAYAGLNAVWIDLHRPLSGGRDLARFIAAQGWAGDPVIGMVDYTMAPIVGYLGIERAYYPNGQRWGSFTIWDQRRLAPVRLEGVFDAQNIASRSATWIASAGTDIDPALLAKYGFIEVAVFSGARELEENYTIFRRTAGIAVPSSPE